MVRRRLITNVVLLFLWVNLAPAAHSPCCCKKVHNASKRRSVSSCCTQKATSTTCRITSQQSVKTCCSTKSKPISAPKSNAFSCGCLICPHAKQMLAATGSGQTPVQSVKRILLIGDAPIEFSNCFHCASEDISDVVEGHLIGITILSRTCSLLI